MFNVAVLVYNLINNYNHTVVDGIVSYFENKDDVRVIVVPVNVPYAQSDNYDYQYWSSVKILKSNDVDGVIIIPNSFSNYIDFDTLSEELQVFSGKPVVSVARQINLPDCKYTFNTSEKAYDLVIEHLKEKHNKSRIAFFGAAMVNSPESEERFDSFRKALAKHGLPFYPELVFQGDFTPGTAEEVLSKIVKTKEDLNFDAICCVNDFTATGCLYHFNKIGVSVPEDVILFGYDDHDIALKVYPRLSSINQNIPMTGAKAAEMIYNMLQGRSVPEKVITDSTPVYRQSCGCVAGSVETSAYYDWLGTYYEKDESRKKAEISSIKKHQRVLSEIYNMINLIDGKISFENVMETLKKAVKISDFQVVLACFYDEPLVVAREDSFIIPEKIRAQLIVDTEMDEYEILPFKKGDEFVLKDHIAPKRCEYYDSGLYVMYPIFMRNKNYGYMICKCKVTEYTLTAINLKIISDILVNAYESSLILKQQQNLLEKNLSLSMSAKTDELTKLFNRRGFMDYGQRLIEMALFSNKAGGVFFCDLDGLKKINDTWGHKIGDLAIKTEAQVLRNTFRESDMIGRLSGDEFAVVAPGFKLEYVETIRRRLADINETLSKEAGLPFTLSISIGVVMFNSENTSLVDLLSQADKQLYVEKEQKHRI